MSFMNVIETEVENVDMGSSRKAKTMRKATLPMKARRMIAFVYSLAESMNDDVLRDALLSTAHVFSQLEMQISFYKDMDSRITQSLKDVALETKERIRMNRENVRMNREAEKRRVREASIHLRFMEMNY